MIKAFLLSILPLVAGNKVTVVSPRRVEEYEYEWPAFRYVPYSDLVNVAAVEALGYTEETWNNPGTLEIEKKAFSGLSDDHQTAATNLGFTPTTWDCDQNHYVGYDWTSLVKWDVEVYWEALGYDSSSWHGITELPETAAVNLFWGELDDAQRAAAEYICYFEETWDGKPLDEWVDVQYDAPTIRYETLSDLANATLAIETLNSSEDTGVEVIDVTDPIDDQKTADMVPLEEWKESSTAAVGIKAALAAAGVAIACALF